MKIKTKFASKMPLLNCFVQLALSGKTVTPTFHKNILKMIQSIEDFYKQLELLSFDVIDFENNDYQKNQNSFIKIINLINVERKLLSKQFGVTETNNFIEGPLKIPVSAIGCTWQTQEQKFMTGNVSPESYENMYGAIFG